jgi:hypothetical protein
MDKNKKLIKSYNDICVEKYQLPLRELDKVVTTCRVCVQQNHPRIYSSDSILCQLWIPSQVWLVWL